MRLLLSKFCEYATQLQNGRHTMVGIFDNIVVPEFPVDHPPFFLCLQFEFDPNEGDQEMTVLAVLIDEDGKQMMDVTAQGKVPRDPRGGTQAGHARGDVDLAARQYTADGRVARCGRATSVRAARPLVRRARAQVRGSPPRDRRQLRAHW